MLKKGLIHRIIHSFCGNFKLLLINNNLACLTEYQINFYGLLQTLKILIMKSRSFKDILIWNRIGFFWEPF